MSLALAIVGWACAAALAVQCARLARRLELVARADHELRSPVSALTLAVESLARRPELRRSAEGLEAHLARLRLGLADLAAARGGRRARPRPGPVALARAARAAAEAWRPAARAEGREVHVDWRAGDLTARTDPARLSQALGNLIGNALEHGTGTIEVRGEHSGDGLRIAVSDEGRDGRPGAVAPRAGDAVARGGALGWKVSRVGGARPRGRGLGIARRAMRDAGGSLESPDVRPPAAREGATDQSPTTVAVWLPATPSRVE